MPVNVLFSAPPALWSEYEDPLGQALSEAGIDATLSTDLPAEEVDYIVYAPNDHMSDFTPLETLARGRRTPVPTQHLHHTMIDTRH